MDRPPAIPIPEETNDIRFDNETCQFVRCQGFNSPGDEVFIYLCKLWSIFLDVLIVVRNPDRTRPPPLSFTFSKYVKFLGVMDDLPDGLRRGKKAPAAAIQLQQVTICNQMLQGRMTHVCVSMYFHQFVMDLFRPYCASEAGQNASYRQPDFDTPEAIFMASTKRE